MFTPPGFRGRFVQQKLILSSNFKCDKIHKIHCYEFGHTLLSYLSQTWMFNKPTSEASLLNKSLPLVATLSVTKFIIIIVIN
jgi:hypothetical protein